MPGKIRVLYVDDESALLELGKLFLEQSGDFTVTTATGAPEAIRLLERERFDVIVSDYQMPEMDGIEFLVLVRARFGKIPFILFTGKGREEVVIQAINNGVDFYLQKGGNPEAQFAELSHKIKSAAARKRAEEAVKRSEEKYRHLIEHSDEAIVVAQDGMLRLVNHRAVEFTGYSEQELLSMSIFTFIHPDDRALVMERYQKRVKGEKSPPSYAFRLGSKDGSTRWVEISISTIDWEGQPATLNFLTDITERKLAEESLNESERRFRELSDLLPQIVYETDANGNLTYANRIAFEWFGYTEEEFRKGLNVLQMIAPHDRERAGAAFRAIIGGTGRRGISDEYRALKKDGDTFPISIYSSPVIVQGRITGLRGIIIDNTERKQAVEALRESEEKYREFFNTSRDCVFITSPDGWFIDFNDATLEMFGYDNREEMSKVPISSLYAHAEDRSVFLNQIVRDGYVKEFPVQLKRRDGTVIDSLITSVPLRNPDGSIKALIGTARDITERKLAEDALVESEEKYRNLYESSADGIASVNMDGRITEANNAFCAMTGYTFKELGQLTYRDLTQEKWHYMEERILREQVVIRGFSDIYEKEYIRKDGSVMPVALRTWLLRDDQGNPLGMWAIVRDITERKRVEAALRHSENRFSKLVAQSPLSIQILDISGKTLLVNRAFEDLWGVPSEQVLGYNLLLDDQSKDTGVSSYLEKAFSGDSVVCPPIKFTPKTESFLGRTRVVQAFIYPIKDESGAIREVILIHLDITERQQAEDALCESESFNRGLVENLPNYIIVCGLDGKILYVNPASVIASGYNAEDLVGTSVLSYVAPEHRDVATAKMSALREEGNSSAYELDIITQDGLRRSVIAKGTHIHYHDSPAILLLLIDITERKRAEEELKESEQKFRDIFNNTTDAIHICAVNDDSSPGRFIDVNKVSLRMLGYSKEEMLTKTPFEITTGNFNQPIEKILKEQRTTGISMFETEHRRKDGSTVPVELNSHMVTILGKKVLIGVARDITERKRAKAALLASEERYHLLAEHMTDIVWLMDMEVKTTYQSPSSEKLRGYTNQEIKDLPLEKNLTPESLKLALEVFFAEITRIKADPGYNPVKILELEYYRKDGTTFWLESKFNIIRDGSGKPVSILGEGRDITERKRAVEALHKANKQLNLLSDITRHDILNQLLVLKGNLALSHAVIETPEALREYIKKEQKAANTIEEQIMFTKDYQNLGVAAPVWQNVNARIKEAVDRLQMRGIHVDVDPANPEVYADPLFEKVFYNLIDNALRYGGDRMKTIRVSSQESDTNLTIICEDDGVGITGEDKKKLFRKGFGKHTGLGLFLSREILAITGITITENGVPGKGARFEITVPKGAYRFAGNV